MSAAITPKRALVSAYRKEGLVPFAQALAARGIELVSTGGSARSLREAGLEVIDVSELTGFPEVFDGRVKTLHPKVHGGLLYRRDLPDHCEVAAKEGIAGIDLLVVDLYPFAETRADPAKTADEILEMVDIGGPAMLRAAAKNWAHVAVISDPAQYESVLADLSALGGQISASLRKRLAAEAFQKTAAYDAMVAEWMSFGEEWPKTLTIPLERMLVTRYGENPHQRAALYRQLDAKPGTIGQARLVSGKEPSYNNLLDASQALEVVRWLTEPALAIIKHGNPCGAAVARNTGLGPAFDRALAGDPVSAYGGILAINRPFDLELGRRLADPALFFEVIVAPSFEEEAVQCLLEGPKWGKSARLLAVGPFAEAAQQPGLLALSYRSVSGGLLVQESDTPGDPAWVVVTSRAPTEEMALELRFAWEICRHVASNGIVIAREGRLVGVGAGQMSRVDSVVIALRKAGAAVQGSVLASDAFFPFADGLELAAEAGVQAVIQPGGSRRDDEVIAAAERAGIAMVFTGRRHFRH